MVKTRVQLSVIALLLGYLGYLLLVNVFSDNHRLSDWKAVLMFLDVTFLTATVGILVCTFVRAKQLSTGSVCFMPNHPLVKLGFVSKEGTNLCPTFWLIGGVITYISFIVLVILGFLAIVAMETFSGNFVQGVGLPALIFIACGGVVALVVWLATQDLWVWKAPLVILSFCLVVILGNISQLVQILYNERHVST